MSALTRGSSGNVYDSEAVFSTISPVRKKVELYERIDDILWDVVPVVILVIGLVGNTLSIVIMSRPSFRETTTRLYFQALAVSDLAFLIAVLLPRYVSLFFETKVWDVNNWLCKSHIFLSYWLMHLSAWYLVGVTIERLIAVHVPHKVKQWVTGTKVWIYLVSVTLVMTGLNIHLVFTVELVPIGNDKFACPSIQSFSFYNNIIFPYVDLVFYMCIPTAVIISGNISIVWRILDARQSTSQMTNAQTVQKYKLSQMTITLMAVTMIFVLLNGPVLVLTLLQSGWLNVEVVIGTEASLKAAKLSLGNTVSVLVMFLNSSINFLLYCLSGPRFRAEVKIMFCGSHASSNSTEISRALATDYNEK